MFVPRKQAIPLPLPNFLPTRMQKYPNARKKTQMKSQPKRVNNNKQQQLPPRQQQPSLPSYYTLTKPSPTQLHETSSSAQALATKQSEINHESSWAVSEYDIIDG